MGLLGLLTTIALEGSLAVGSGVSPAEAASLEEAIARWNKMGATDYSFAFQLQCNCAPDETARVRIEVVDETITDVSYEQDVYEVHYLEGRLRTVPLYSKGMPVRDELAERFQNIDSLLTEMKSLTSDPLAEYEAVFDAETGVPCRVYYNFSGPAVDDEVEFVVSEFAFNKESKTTQLGCAAEKLSFEHSRPLEDLQ